MAPSVELTAQLLALDLTAMSFAELLDVAAAWERVRSWSEAQQNDALVALDRAADVRLDGGDPAHSRQWHTEELGIALGVSGPAARARVRHAVTLVEVLPHTAAALKAGSITGHHARLAVTNCFHLPAGVARAVDRAAHSAADDLMDPARSIAARELTPARSYWRTPRQFEQTLARLILEADPDAAEDRRRRAVGDRDVRFRDTCDGMSAMWALLPAEDARTVAAALDARARASAAHPDCPQDGRTLAQRRADALTDLAAAALTAPDAPTVHGRRPTVNVTVAWTTLLGLDDLPADLTGYGPIDAATARRIATDPTSTWRALLVDPLSGALLDCGRATYSPPPDLAAYVIARDNTCRHPTCDAPALLCDLDHRTPWTAGGHTCRHNIDALCERHHPLKHLPGWDHERDPDTGDSIWTTPTGRTARRPAYRHPVGTPLHPPDSEPTPLPDDPPF